MQDSNNTLQFKDTLELKIKPENSENLQPNDQSVQCNDDTLGSNGKRNLNMKINDNKNNLRENPEEPTTQTNSVYKVLEDSYMKYSDCGEPFQPQHIKIDFTPVPGVDDNAFLQKKCMDFWKFVNEHPKLQSFEIEEVSQSSTNETISQSSTNETIINKRSGDQGSSQYIEVPAVKYMQHPGPVSNFGFKSRSGIKKKSSIIKSRGLDEVHNLCHKMEEWDLSHPKSMEPPKRVPSSRDDLTSHSSSTLISTLDVSSQSSSLNNIK